MLTWKCWNWHWWSWKLLRIRPQIKCDVWWLWCCGRFVMAEKRYLIICTNALFDLPKIVFGNDQESSSGVSRVDGLKLEWIHMLNHCILLCTENLAWTDNIFNLANLVLHNYLIIFRSKYFDSLSVVVSFFEVERIFCGPFSFFYPATIWTKYCSLNSKLWLLIE